METVFRLIAILATVVLGACATQGGPEIIKTTYPRGEVISMVAHGQWSTDWMLDGSKLKLNYLVKGDVTAEQLAAVAKTEESCRIFTQKTRPNALVAVLSNGILYGAAGYIGVGMGAKAFSPSVNSHEYARYGAWASGVAGAANGVVTLGGQTYTFENCSRENLDAVSQYGVRVIIKSPY